MTFPALRDLINQHFNDSELRQLCFDLSVEYENLPGDTRITKAQSFVMHCLRCTGPSRAARSQPIFELYGSRLVQTLSYSQNMPWRWNQLANKKEGCSDGQKQNPKRIR